MATEDKSAHWWCDVLEHVGRASEPKAKGPARVGVENPIYARSLARAHLAELRPLHRSARG